MGLMPHPERAWHPLLGGSIDGLTIWQAFISTVSSIPRRLDKTLILVGDFLVVVLPVSITCLCTFQQKFMLALA